MHRKNIKVLQLVAACGSRKSWPAGPRGRSLTVCGSLWRPFEPDGCPYNDTAHIEGERSGKAGWTAAQQVEVDGEVRKADEGQVDENGAHGAWVDDRNRTGYVDDLTSRMLELRGARQIGD